MLGLIIIIVLEVLLIAVMCQLYAECNRQKRKLNKR